jgi:hypothetical protein
VAFARAPRRLVALVAAIVLLAATLVSGTGYLWCVPMQRAMRDCCCNANGASDSSIKLGDAGEPAPTLARACCCHSRVADALPSAGIGQPLEGVPPALATVAALPAVAVDRPRAMSSRSLVPRPPPAAFERTRAGPRSAAAVCVVLQVFRC